MSNLNAVSTSKFVKITSQVLAATGSGFSLTGLVLTKNDALPFCQPFEFFSSEAVRSYFGATSDEYKFAKDYFNGYTNKTRNPKSIIFCNYDAGTAAAWIRGAQIGATVAELEAIEDGAMKITVAGTEVSLSGISFDGLTSYSAMAGAIQTKLRSAGDTAVLNAAVVEWDASFKAFKITLGANTASDTISYASAPASGTDLSAVLKLRETDGAVISDVIPAALSIEEYMDKLTNVTKSFFSFCHIWSLSSDADRIAEDLAFAKWNAEQGVRFSFVEFDNSSVDKDATSSADFASRITELGYSGTICNYGSSALAAFVMGTLACIDFSQPNGRITLAFKTGAATEITCDNDLDYDALTTKGYNAYVRDASAANTFTGYQRGSISGDYRFIDAYADHVWLNDAMQVSLRGALGSANALPYNEASYGRLLGSIKSDIDTAIQAGVINIGIEPSNEAIMAISADTGLETSSIKNSLYAAGWIFYAKNPTSEARADRQSPVLKFWYSDGGSIQKIDLTSVALL